MSGGSAPASLSCTAIASDYSRIADELAEAFDVERANKRLARFVRRAPSPRARPAGGTRVVNPSVGVQSSCADLRRTPSNCR